MPKIRTTHTGSLPRPAQLRSLLVERDGTGIEPPALAAETLAAVIDVLARQIDVGLDLVNDGEQGRSSYSTYVTDRLSGFEAGRSAARRVTDQDDYPDLAARSQGTSGTERPLDPACTGPIALHDRDAVLRDIARVKAAAATAGIDPERLFMSAASPGVIAHFCDNLYYSSREEYLGALVDAMRFDYRAIVEAGITLQLDCPDFAMSYNNRWKHLSSDEFVKEVGLTAEALNAATEGIAPDKMRMHVCWGNTESPHTHDIPLASIVDLVLGCRPAGISLEACNPRHAHEWKVFEDVALPSEKYLIPGVVDTTTNFVEHPELIAQRLANYARVVGPDRVVAGTDCGFGTFVGSDRVAQSVVWAKLASMVEGAEIASSAL